MFCSFRTGYEEDEKFLKKYYLVVVCILLYVTEKYLIFISITQEELSNAVCMLYNKYFSS